MKKEMGFKGYYWGGLATKFFGIIMLCPGIGIVLCQFLPMGKTCCCMTGFWIIGFGSALLVAGICLMKTWKYLDVYYHDEETPNK
jgi:hypothetical protein